MTNGLSHVAWFVRIKLSRSAFADCAKAAVTGADIPGQHKSCRAIGPALENVRTPCFLTNRVQIQSFDQLEQMVLVGGIAQTDTEPLGLWLTWFVVKDLEFAGQFLLPQLMKSF